MCSPIESLIESNNAAPTLCFADNLHQHMNLFQPLKRSTQVSVKTRSTSNLVSSVDRETKEMIHQKVDSSGIRIIMRHPRLIYISI